ncbi:MAG: hypothetical protein ACM3Y9_09535 [Ignavibacteria bacterium]
MTKPPRTRWGKIVRKWLVSRYRLGRLVARFGLRPLDGNPLAAVKRSDTLFVLGSGDSINDLRPDEWAQIAAADSVGFNNWYLHDFVPSAFVTEPGSDRSQLALEYASIARRYRDTSTLILLKDLERYRPGEMAAVVQAMPADLRPRLALSWDWEPGEENPERFAALLARLDRLGVMVRPYFPVMRKRATVFFLVMLALRAGYRRIVLCGIDLNGSDYFYERHRGRLEAQGLWLPPRRAPLAVHRTEDPDYGSLTVSRALGGLEAQLLRPRGIALEVALQSSRLYPALPCCFGR